MDSQQRVVFFVDDEPSIVESATMILELASMRVCSACDGQSAIAQIEAGINPDVIISDFRLPGGMDGVEVVRRTRELLRREVPALITTGDTRQKLLTLPSSLIALFFVSRLIPTR